MRKNLAVTGLVCALAWLLPAQAAFAQAPADDADAQLAEFKALTAPAFDRTRADDAAYRQEYQQKMQEAMTRKAQVAKSFYDRFPDHPEIGKVMEERWRILSMTGERDVVEEETTAVLEQKPDSELAHTARFVRAQVALHYEPGYESKLQAIEQFIEKAPKDPRGGDMLAQLASFGTDDPNEKMKLLKRVQADYPDAPAAKRVTGKLRQAEGVGKPFELSFTDAISGKSISMSDLNGKVVVVDFWATWCGPCVAEMPHMKELYSQYRNKGVEFIGVSLDAPEDQGGLDALKKFVAENQIEWPQYYQGKGWQGEFSMSWGIDSIPALFVVDADGKLHSTNARGKLDTMIPELIAKRDNKQATAR